MVPVFLLYERPSFYFLGPLFHSSVVPVFIVFPRVSSEGEDSSLLFKGVVVFLLRGLRKCDVQIGVLGPQIFLGSQGAFCLFYLSFDQVWVV